MLAGVTGRLRAGERRFRSAYAVGLLWRAYLSFRRHGGAMYAAAVSYYVLFSLFPLLVFAVAAFGLVVRGPALQEWATDAIVRQLPEEANLRAQVEEVVAGASRGHGGILGMAGLLGATWTARAAFGALRRGLTRAFDAPGTRPAVRGRVTDLLGAFGILVLALLSVAATAALGVLRAVAADMFGGVPVNLAWGLLYALAPLTVSFLACLLIYGVVPKVTAPVSRLWVAALLAAVGLELAKAGFGLYVVTVGRYREVYGALGGAAAFLFFVFLAASILLFSAEVAAELARDRAPAAGQRERWSGARRRTGAAGEAARGRQ